MVFTHIYKVNLYKVNLYKSQTEFTRMSATNTNEFISSIISLVKRDIIDKLSVKYEFSAEEAFTFLNTPEVVQVQVVQQPVQQQTKEKIKKQEAKEAKEKKTAIRLEKLKIADERRQAKAAIREEKGEQKEEAKLAKAALKAALKTVKKNTITIDKSELSFTTAQVEIMTDEELLENFTKVTGTTHLACNHCHYDKVELPLFVKTIRRWCLKKENRDRPHTGMFKEMQIPKTCDHQAAANRLRQPYYTKISKATTDKQLADLKKANTHLFGPDRRKKTVRA